MLTKKKICIATLWFFVLLANCFVSCGNFHVTTSDDETDGWVRFSISDYETESRTIVPTSADKENLFFTLMASQGGVEQTVLHTTEGTAVEYMSYTDLGKAAFRLATGIWNFTLVGYKKTTESESLYMELVSGSAEAEITSGSGNAITFKMKPVDNGEGTINVTLEYEFGIETQSTVSKILAELKAIDFNSECTIADTPAFTDTWEVNGSENSTEITAPVAGQTLGSGSFTYTKSDVPSGTYLLTFTVTSKNTQTTGVALQGYRSDVVIIAAGSESSSVLPIRLRQVYSVTFEGMTDGGAGSYWVDGYTPPEYYSSYETLVLPVKSNTSHGSAVFDGWYTTDSYTGDPVTQIGYGTSVTGKPVTYYAKWRENIVYVSPDGVDSPSYGASLAMPYETINYAIGTLNDANLDWTVYVNGVLEGAVSIGSAQAKTITLEGYNFDATAESVSDAVKDSITVTSGSALTVSSSVPVTVKKLKINGGTGTTSSGTTRGGAVYVNTAGTKVYLDEGTLVIGGTATQGAGVYVQDGLVTLNGGTIDACGTSTESVTSFGGGVYVDDHGSFVFNCGAVTNNGSESTEKGGGIYSVGTLKIAPADGTTGTTRTISGNKAKEGGGVYTTGSSDVITEAVITGNTAVTSGGGIYTSGTLTLAASKVGRSGAGNTAQTGGGVYNTGTLTIEGTQSASGSVSNNTASASDGAAGAGVFNAGNAILTLQGNASLTFNAAENGNGGAVYNAGAFTMQTAYSCSPSISYGSAVNGGGVYSDGTNATFTMSAGNIADNNATTSGGGVYNAATMYMYGDAVIGDAGATTVATAVNTGSSNKATDGAGIYNTGLLQLGYKDTTTPETLSKGIYHNYASGSGAGIYSAGDSAQIIMASGSIAFNYACVNGGGVYNGKDFVFAGGFISDNRAKSNGGGVINNNKSTMTMTGDAVIGNAGVTSLAEKDAGKHSNIAASGGGIYNMDECTLTLGTAQNPLTGGIYYNYASTDGGGLFNAGVTTVNSGYIRYNGVVTPEEGETTHAGVAGKLSDTELIRNYTAGTEGNGYIQEIDDTD
ncbi:MAG: hypothetical protein K6G80_07660 [Treponema sp.]|nr:hypothetical protein [Treponema sp.]